MIQPTNYMVILQWDTGARKLEETPVRVEAREVNTAIRLAKSVYDPERCLEAWQCAGIQVWEILHDGSWLLRHSEGTGNVIIL